MTTLCTTTVSTKLNIKDTASLLKQIDTSNYIGWDSWWITMLHSKYPVGPTGHLLEDGHKAVSNKILAHDQI